jgi:hypothetical protein
MKKLSIRVDDFPGTKPAEFDKHNLESFKEFHMLMMGFFPEYILGVIPRYVGAAELSWLGKRKVDLALHGIDHDERPLNMNEFERFISWGLEEREEAIEKALYRELERFAEMSGQRPMTYIPPHNVIDSATIRSLGALGFRKVMAGPGVERLMTPEAACRLCDENRMEFVYSSSPLEYGRSDELLTRGSVEHISWKLKTEDVCLTLHFPWEVNIGLVHLERYLTILKKYVEN